MKQIAAAPASALSSPQALNQAVWQICDVLRRSNCASALQYVPELTWILFLRVLDEQEAIEREEAEALGLAYTPSLASPYRWQDWAAPWSDKPAALTTSDGRPLGWRRRALQEGRRGEFFAFANGELLPHLRGLRNRPGASPKQKVISEKDNLAYPFALANLVLHGIDEPHLWHGNTLSRQTVYGGLWEGAPERFHVMLTNPPFGGKEGRETQGPFPFKTRATQVLFVQYVMQILEPGGRCGIVLDKRGTPEAETEHSWTLDFAERRRAAADEAAPHRRAADAQRERATALREQARALRKAGKAEDADALPPRIDAAEKAARESLAKAQVIEDAVFDLKAVNPREKKVLDARTDRTLPRAYNDPANPCPATD